jgi:hypothetical protein
MTTVPFTFAHPAAVLPLRRFCPGYLLWSALIIGSICPDAAYFLPMLPVNPGGSALGFGLAQDLAVGLLLFTAWHAFMKRPVVLLLPTAHREALWPAANAPLGPMVGVSLRLLPSLLLGAGLHRAWDCFTHRQSWCAAQLPVLQQSLLRLGSYELYVTRVLQHGSTIAALTAMLWVYLRWLNRASSRGHDRIPTLRPGWRPAARLLILGVASVAGAVSGGRQAFVHPGGSATGGLVRFVIAFVTILGLGLAVWSLVYRLWRHQLEERP